MASVSNIRDFVSLQYGGEWPNKVARMSDNQVMAIYSRMLDISNLKKNYGERKNREQMCLFDPGYVNYILKENGAK